jgi:hypothetical protein
MRIGDHNAFDYRQAVTIAGDWIDLADVHLSGI